MKVVRVLEEKRALGQPVEAIAMNSRDFYAMVETGYADQCIFGQHNDLLGKKVIVDDRFHVGTFSVD